MQFMLMCCSESEHWSSLPESERDQVMRDYEQWVRDQVASGHYLAGGKLDESHTASTLREMDGRMKVTDGPFSEAKEQIGGYHLIECRDRAEAIAIARKIPTLRVGSSVEVRPLLYQNVE
ncbi:MAG TPA: YciI family protein [Gammaproteobacteria bacterium]